MKNRFWSIYLIITLSVVVGCLIGARNEPVPFRVECETAEQTSEPEFTCAMMYFTETEASALLERFRAEKEEAARQARIRAERQRATYSPSYFRRAGVLHWNGWRWTWYSERILPGHGLRIPGRHTDAQGYVRDGNGYLCLASDAIRRGTVIDTPLGSLGKVYDCGCGMTTIDVYVGW